MVTNINLNRANQKKLEKIGLRILHQQRYRIDDNISLEMPCNLQNFFISNFEMGAFSHVESKRGQSYVKIGRYSCIAANSKLNVSNHPLNWLSIAAFQYCDNFFGEKNDNCLKNIESKQSITEIGNDVWIGDSVVIKAGVKIEDGAIVGAGAVVIKDVPAYAIVAGVPAKIIRYRFEPSIIERLLTLKWWEYDYKYFKNIDFDQIELAIEQIKTIIASGIPKYEGKILKKDAERDDFKQFLSFKDKFKYFRRYIRARLFKLICS